MKICSYLICAIIYLTFPARFLTVRSYPADDKIIELPGQPGVTFHQFSGYVTVNLIPQTQFFYYLVEAEEDPSSKPLVLTLNGGPGCPSSTTAFYGNGPFRPSGYGAKLIRNEYSWNKVANVLYLDSPAHVGFSYSTPRSPSSNCLNDAAIDIVDTIYIIGWYDKFPEYKGRDFYLCGHSYAAHYIPTLVELMMKSNSTFNLRGIMLGNPLLEYKTDMDSTPAFLWSHGMLSDSTYDFIEVSNCTFEQWVEEHRNSTFNMRDEFSLACSAVEQKLVAEFAHRSFQNVDITLDSCSRSTVLQFDLLKEEEAQRMHTSCLGGLAITYLNRSEVRSALHSDLSVTFPMCNPEIYFKYSMDDIRRSMLPILGSIIRSGIPVFITSGDQDVVCPFTATRILVNRLAKDLGLKTTTPYSPWLHKTQIGGWMHIYDEGNLTFATVRGGGHYIPTKLPEISLILLQRFLNGTFKVK